MSRCQRECHRFESDILLQTLPVRIAAIAAVSKTAGLKAHGGSSPSPVANFIYDAMADWLGESLQNFLERFDSVWHLHLTIAPLVKKYNTVLITQSRRSVTSRGYQDSRIA